MISDAITTFRISIYVSFRHHQPDELVELVLVAVDHTVMHCSIQRNEMVAVRTVVDGTDTVDIDGMAAMDDFHMVARNTVLVAVQHQEILHTDVSVSWDGQPYLKFYINITSQRIHRKFQTNFTLMWNDMRWHIVMSSLWDWMMWWCCIRNRSYRLFTVRRLGQW